MWSVFIKVVCGYGRAGILWFREDGVDLSGSISASKVMTFGTREYAAKDAAEIPDVGFEPDKKY